MPKKKKTTKPKDFRILNDSDVFNVWLCPTEGCGANCEINPSYHQQNGNPMCGECDVEMRYDHTIVRI